jgi:serine/threonine protein phosphatase 1
MQRIAAIGDIHGCIEEFESLLKRLEWVSLDQIIHLGDLVDRGPDSGAVVALCRERNIPGVMGNHEESILRLWKRYQRDPNSIASKDKLKTISQLKAEDIEYLQSMPLLQYNPEMNVCLVHGGVWPEVDINAQPGNVIRCQMIRDTKPGDTRWWGRDAASHKSGRTEEQNRQDGYFRWYEKYKFPFDTYYGHSVFTQPFIYQNEGAGRTIGIDTGSCFGGALTAAIIGDEHPWFITIKSRKVWFEHSYRTHQE